MIDYTRRDAIKALGMIAGTSVLPGCAYNPVTGKRQLVLMTEQQEIAMGQQANVDIVAQYGIYDNTAIQDWVTARGREMGPVTHRSNLDYHFTVLDSPVVNAFAVPGGYVYITRGILAYFNNEAQFAGVLAHELGHVNARHSVTQYSKAQLASLALNLGTVFSEEFAKYAQFASMGMQLLFLKYSRDDEREADRLGVEYSSAVGYDATEMSLFFQTLDRMRPEGETLPSFLSTHPNPENRQEDTRRMALDYQREHPDRQFVVRRNEYLATIDGIVFGDDPRQGYVEDGVFYQPKLRFSFPVIQGWQVSNMPSEVRMQPEDGSALQMFTLAKGTSPGDAASQFAAQNDVVNGTTSTVSINNRNSVVLEGRIQSQQGEVALISYFVPFGQQLFAFHGIAAADAIGNYAESFRNTAYGLHELTQTSKINVSPKTVEVRTVDSNKLVSKAFNDFGVPEDKNEALAVMNGVELYDLMQAGTKLKIVG